MCVNRQTHTLTRPHADVRTVCHFAELSVTQTSADRMPEVEYP